MEAKENNMHILLETFSEDIQALQKSVAALVDRMAEMKSDIKAIADNTAKPPVINATADTKPVIAVVQQGLSNMKMALEAQPKNIIRKIQLLPFSPEEAQKFYGMLFGRVALILIALLLVFCSYRYFVHHDEISQRAKLMELENDRIRKAWNDLYRYGSKKQRQEMEDRWKKQESK